jgi:DNA-directed RNA polymerase specialized sigma24 family protein
MRYRPVTDVRDARLLSATEPMEALYREIGPNLWRSLFAYSGDREIASDALAEAFAQAIARGDEVRSPEPWIWTAAFRIAAGELARRKPNALGLREPSYELPAPADHLVTALKRLPANQRIAVVMHDYADRSSPPRSTGGPVPRLHRISPPWLRRRASSLPSSPRTPA